MRRLLLALLSLTAMSESRASAASHNLDIDRIFRSVLARYAEELKETSVVCVQSDASNMAFYPVRSGMVRPDRFPDFFREDDLNRAFRGVLPRDSARIRAADLPRKFRLSRKDCR